MTARGIYSTARDAENSEVRTVAVVGAGLSGLVVAYELKRRGLNVRLYEAAPRAGGVIGTTSGDGFLAEHGPNSCTFTTALEALTNVLGIHDQIVDTNASANKRFLVRDGSIVEAPRSPGAVARTPLLTARAKLRVLLEPFVGRRDLSDEVSVATFVEDRFGKEILTYVVDPMVSGIFAGDPSRLSMMHAFPQMFSLAQKHGSVIRGILDRQLRSRRERDTNKSRRPRATRRSISFRNGMQTLTESLASAVGNSLILGSSVRMVNIDEHQQKWSVESANEERVRTHSADAFVMATSACAFTEMELPAQLRRPAMPIERIEYPPVSSLTLGFRRDDVSHPLDGFGMLVPSIEGRSLLGVLFNSSLFPGRAPDGHVALTCFLGGARNPEIGSLTTGELLRLVDRDLRELLGVSGAPVWVHHSFWQHAIPQYNVGYQSAKDAIVKAEASNPGFFIAGSFREGISVGDCVTVAQHTAERVAAYLSQRG